MLVTCFDCAERDEEALRDRLAGATLAISSSTSRSRGERSSIGSSRRWRPTSSLTTAGSSADSALGDAAHRAGELRDVSDAVLEQVAEALRALGEELHRVGGLDELERTRTPIPSCWSRIFFAATSPSSVWVGGMRMSTTATSGLCIATWTEQILRVSDWATTRTPPPRAAARSLAQQHRVVREHDAQRGGARAGAQGREVAAEPGLVELEDPLRLRQVRQEPETEVPEGAVGRERRRGGLGGDDLPAVAAEAIRKARCTSTPT